MRICACFPFPSWNDQDVGTRGGEGQIRLALRQDRRGAVMSRCARWVLPPLVIIGGSLGEVFASALPASASASISFPPGFTPSATSDVELTLNTSSSTVDMPAAYANVGDLAMLIGHYNSSTNTISSIAGTRSGTWTLQYRHDDPGITTGSDVGKTTDVWTAPVTSTSGADVLTIHYSASMGGVTAEYWPESLTAGLGTSTVWTYPAASSSDDNSGSSASIYYASLRADTPNTEVYVGVAGVVGTAKGGTTPNFAFTDSTIDGNEIAYDLGLSPGSTYSPASTQAPSGAYSTASIIIAATSSQSITFSAPATGAVGGSAGLTPTSTSGLAVSLSVDAATTNSACRLSGTSVTYAHAGSCVLDANQGGNADYAPASQVQTTIAVGSASPGYLIVAASGRVYAYGSAHSSSRLVSRHNRIVAIAPSPGDTGYYLVTKLGNVYNFGGAPSYGSTARVRLQSPVSAFATTPDGKGYWLGLANGRVYSFGDARSLSSLSLNPRVRPLVAIVPSPDGKGYYLVTKRGNVYSFGNATWYGSMAHERLSAPVTAFATAADGNGYWLGLANGAVYGYGSAKSYPRVHLNRRVRPLVAIVPSLDGEGYYLVTKLGNIYSRGDATWYGSPVHADGTGPIVSAVIPY